MNYKDLKRIKIFLLIITWIILHTFFPMIILISWSKNIEEQIKSYFIYSSMFLIIISIILALKIIMIYRKK